MNLPVTLCPNARNPDSRLPSRFLFAEATSLIRARPEHNEWRFYRMEVWPDLFGRALLLRQWGRMAPKAGAGFEAPRVSLVRQRDMGPCEVRGRTSSSCRDARRVGPRSF